MSKASSGYGYTPNIYGSSYVGPKAYKALEYELPTYDPTYNSAPAYSYTNPVSKAETYTEKQAGPSTYNTYGSSYKPSGTSYGSSYGTA